MGENLAEEMEHAAHSGGIGKYIGMTMAVLGVLLALCSAMVGGTRTELIATMVEQTGTSQQYQAVAMKYRTLMAQLQQLHALLPSDPHDFDKAENEIIAIQNAAAHDPLLPIITSMRLVTGQILNTVTPTGADILRFVSLVRDYEKQAESAKKWTESYEDAIKAYGEATEHYEWAQLCAEFGIVCASIALLLQSKLSWGISVGMGIASMALVGWSYTSSSAELTRAGHEIEEGKKAYLALNMDAAQAKDDEALLKDIERIEEPAAKEEKDKAAAAGGPAHAPEVAEHHDAPPAHSGALAPAHH